MPGSARRLMRLTVDRAALAPLPAADTLTLKTDTVVTVEIRNAKGAMAALDQCEAKLLASWGVDPAAAPPGISPPVPLDPGRMPWFTIDTYSDATSQTNIKGRVVIVLRVGEDGRVADCRVVVSASPAIDRNSCAMARRRARYAPAKDAAGKPVASWSVLPVRWVDGQGKIDD